MSTGNSPSSSRRERGRRVPQTSPPGQQVQQQSDRSRRASQTPLRGRPVQQRSNRNWLWLLIGGAVVLLGVVLALVWRNQAPTLSGVTEYPNLSRDHDDQQPLTYEQTPPVGGVHRSSWQNCGIYDQPVPNEFAVHSLEHGAVWITYRPDLPANEVEELRALASGRSHVLLSPYPDLPAPIVASAWGVQLTIGDESGGGSAGDSRLAEFIAEYERGPQTPEPGASCRGGNGTPIQ